MSGVRMRAMYSRMRTSPPKASRAGVRLERAQSLLELADERCAERVADVGTVQGERGDSVRHVDEEGFVGHAASSRPSTMSRNCFRMRAVGPQMMSSTDTS